jgi:ABC-type antimicrobial peptide transport system ATPase subunit
VNILEVRNLTVWFPRRSSLLRRTIGHVKAVTGVSFVIPTGKTPVFASSMVKNKHNKLPNHKPVNSMVIGCPSRL